MDLIEKLGLNGWILAAQVVNFLLLLFILKKFLYKPILDVLKKREDKIAKSLTDADAITERLKTATKESEEIIATANRKSLATIEEANKRVEMLRQQGLEKTREEAKKILVSAKEEIESEKNKLVSEAKKELAGLVMLATKKVVGDSVDEKTNDKIVNKVVSDLK